MSEFNVVVVGIDAFDLFDVMTDPYVRGVFAHRDARGVTQFYLVEFSPF